MAYSQHESKLAKYKDMPGGYSTPVEALFAPKRSWVEQRKWDIPDAFVIKDEMIKNNVSVVRQVVAMVEALGREVATADDYRRFIGARAL